MNDCIFCKIIAHQLPAIVLYENTEVKVFLSLENHPLVVTKKHIKDIYEMDEKLGAAVMRAAVKISKATKKALNPDGINLIQANEPAANQDVFHFHLHIKPRWKNDKVILEWMTDPVDEKEREKTAQKIRKNLDE